MANILVIDDEEYVRFSFRRVLEEGGYTVFEAVDGEDGMSQFKQMVAASLVSDVIITDIFMPEKDGYSTITEIKELSPETKIIAISGGGLGAPRLVLDTSKALGADCVLAKPVSSEQLLEAVGSCLA